MKRSRFAVCGSLCVALSLAVVSVGCRSTSEREERATKVLMIGNSFSITLLHYLPQVAADRGIDLDLCSLYIGGCSLKRHCDNVASNAVSQTFRPYLCGRNRLGTFTQAKRNVCDVLRETKWDIVTIQQASHQSWKPESFHPHGDDLVDTVRRLAPQAKIVVQETWSYTPWDKRLGEWGIDQDEMYAKLHAAYRDFAAKQGLEVLPFGTAVQEWRRRLPVRYTERSFGGDVVGGRYRKPEDCFSRSAANGWVPNCDVFHLNEKGEYFQALLWAARLLDADLDGLEYRPECVSEDEAMLMKRIIGDL